MSKICSNDCIFVVETYRILIMNIILIVVGKTDEEWLSKGIEEYKTRIGRFIRFDIQVIPDLKKTRNINTEAQKTLEGERILKLIRPSDEIILLDEKGAGMSSSDMASWLEKRLTQSAKRLVFIIGGPYGFSPEIYGRASEKLSLSRMTFSHQMVRLIFTEQLYRAFSIINNLPYHHD